MLVIFEFNIIANCIVFETIEKQWQLPISGFCSASILFTETGIHSVIGI